MEEEETEGDTSGLPAEAEKKLSLQRQFYACSYVFFTPMVFGVISVHKSHFSDVFQPIISKGMSMMIFVTAELAGTLLAGVSLHFIGRKPNVILANVLNLAAPIFLGVGYENMTGFIAMVIGLIGACFGYVAFQMHVAEVTDNTFRAFFIGFINLGYNVGFSAGKIISGWAKSEAAFCLILMMSSLVLSFHVPETPFYLALSGRRDEAEEIFTWLRAGTSSQTELNVILDKAEVAAEQRGTTANIFSRRLGIPSLILFFALLTFIYPHLYHGAAYHVLVYTAFGPGGSGFTLPKSTTSILGFDEYVFFKLIAPVVGSLIFLGVNFVVPRKTLFLLTFVMSLFLFIVYPNYRDPQGRALIVHAGSFAWVLTNIGTVPVLDVLSLEIFPDSFRHFGPVIYSSFRGMIHFIRYGSNDEEMYASAYSCLVNISLCLPVGLVFTFLFMPETKGMTLAEAEKASSILEVQVFRKQSQERPEEEEI